MAILTLGGSYESPYFFAKVNQIIADIPYVLQA